jgi:NAD(P)H dehydrogenase (quinone)
MRRPRSRRSGTKWTISISFPPFLVQHLVEVAQNYRDGIFSGVNDVVETITGTPPLTVQQFIAQNRVVFA